jgi:hypothetical protein
MYEKEKDLVESEMRQNLLQLLYIYLELLYDPFTTFVYFLKALHNFYQADKDHEYATWLLNNLDQYFKLYNKKPRYVCLDPQKKIFRVSYSFKDYANELLIRVKRNTIKDIKKRFNRVRFLAAEICKLIREEMKFLYHEDKINYMYQVA